MLHGLLTQPMPPAKLPPKLATLPPSLPPKAPLQPLAAATTRGAAARNAIAAHGALKNASAAIVARGGGDDNGGAAARLDYSHLLDLALGAPGELGRPADPSESGPLGPLWPDGAPDWYTNGLGRMRAALVEAGRFVPGDNSPASDTSVSPPAIVLVWEPGVLKPDDYAELVAALGDLVRSEGGAGIQRVKAQGFGVPVAEEVPSL